MVANANKSSKSRENLGRAMLWLGSLAFLAETWVLLRRLGEFWQNSGGAALGWLAALGTGLQRLAASVAWNQGLFLDATGKVLVLCCPLVVAALGIALLRQATISGEMVETAKEERR